MSLIGRRLGIYQIESLLGAGGMGEVYRARDTRLGRDVAIKILPEAFVADRERLARFEREARVLASLNHPNIAQIYGLEEQPPSIVMELVAGDTLADRIHHPDPRTDRLSIAEGLRIARQIIDALETAHERGIVHRDLKPANIKITPDGVVKVLDFGLAKAESEVKTSDLTNSPTITSDHTRTGMILGTAAYMSPEQARGKAVDKRTDIWAFGCVLYEMLAACLAFPGETLSDTIGVILHREPDWGALPADLSPRIYELLKRCLQKDARLRLRDIGDARYELDSRSDWDGPTAVAAPTRSRLPWALAALSLVAAIGAVGWTMRTGAGSSSSVPQLSQAIRITNTQAEEFGPAISPDGKWVAYYSNNGSRSDLLVKYLDSGATLNLTASLNLELPARAGVGGVSISPDGSQIAFGARPDPAFPQFDTWVMPGPVGGTPRKLLPSIPAMQWSPDGKLIAYTMPGSTRGDALGVSSSDGTGERIIVDREGGRHIHWPAWSRDGQYIYFIYTYDTWHVEPSEIYRVSLAGGTPEPVVKSVRRAVYPVPMPSGDLLFSANPKTLDLGLWWKRAGTTDGIALTNGVGEHIETRSSADGRRLVSTLVTMRESLVALPAAGAGSPEKLTDGYGNDLYPSVDYQHGRMAFSSARSGHRNLWIANADGSDPTPLTTESSIDDRPTFSPDGQQLAFVSDRGGEQGIWIINAAGGAPRLLAHVIVLDTLSWSHDGRRIFFARPTADLPVLASVSVADGKVEAYATPTPGAVSPGWSPGGEMLAYLEPLMVPVAQPSTATAARMYLRFLDANGKQLFPQLPPAANFSNGFLAWAPDGKRVAVASVAANGPAQIWVVEPTSPQPFKRLVELPTAFRPRGLTWSKDGARVIYASQEFNGDIVLYDLNK
jgi:serine/threonine protein kinase/dipeptidyl aminopeptidase/acylaminoacyl peptidase